MNRTETDRLLLKILGELRDLNARLARMAGEPTLPRPKSEAAPTVSVRRGPEGVHVTESSELPSAKSDRMKELETAQRPGGGGKPVAHSEPFRTESNAVRLTGEQLRSFDPR